MKKIIRWVPSIKTKKALEKKKADPTYISYLSDKVSNREALGAITKSYSRNPLLDLLHTDLLKIQSDKQCAYCETISTGSPCTVEHIKPRLDNPESAFDWENFLMSCHNCNTRKNDNYPIDFLDPSESGYSFQDNFGFRDNVFYRYITPEAENTWECIWINSESSWVIWWNPRSIDERKELLISILAEGTPEAMKAYIKCAKIMKWYTSYLTWLENDTLSPLFQKI